MGQITEFNPMITDTDRDGEVMDFIVDVFER